MRHRISANSFAVRKRDSKKSFSNRIFAFCFSVSEIGSGAQIAAARIATTVRWLKNRKMKQRGV
jgi:hypothetical protein